MRSFFTKIVLLALACLWQLSVCNAQGWERTFGNAKTDDLVDVLTTPDGGYIAVGSTQVVNGLDIQVQLVKTDADGAALWTKVLGDDLRQEYPKSIVSDGNGGYVISGTAIDDGIPYAFAARTDQYGNQVWLVTSVQDSVEGRQIIRTSDGNYAMIGSLQNPSSMGALEKDVYLMKLDENGNILWSKTYGGSNYDEGRGLIETSSNEFLLAGFTSSFGAGGYDVYLLKTNASGDPIWTKTLGTSNPELCYAITSTTDGNFAITGQQETTSSSVQDAYLAKIDGNGNQIWWTTYPLPGIETMQAVQQVGIDGHFVLVGNTQENALAHRQLLMIKTWPDGSMQWQNEFGGVLGDGGYAIKIAPNSGFVMAGFTNSFGAGGRDGYLLRTDATGISLSNFIEGTLHSNLNNTCVPDNFGVMVSNYLVEIAGAKTYYGTTDANGHYFVPVEAGDYNIRLLNPSPIWITCQDSIDVTLVGSFDTAAVDFSIYSEVQCPAMEVDLSTLGLRRCFPNAYDINYRNLGSLAANTAAVQLDFDPWLTVDSTSIPWIAHTGQTYVFDVGAVQPFEQGSFKVWVTLDCDSTFLGQTHCSEAHIFPDSLCFDPDPNWDGSSIELEATCNTDSVYFKVKNTGAGDMVDPLELIVIEEVLIGYQTQFQLAAFEDTTFVFPATGATFRMEAEQSLGHPGNSQPCVSVEGCGASPFSTGFVIDYPLNDADLFVDTDCRENIGSFDPNDKQAFPEGYGEHHFIEPGTDIEYLIRFQNTGTDTAFTVTVRDTLSQFLDPASIEPGAASHPYRYELYGNGILKFTFDNIMLPDSNANESLSHGFVKFRAKQRQTNTTGIIIKNRAGIYFDFNAPVITNTVFHTLAKDFILIDPASSDKPGTAPKPGVRVYPNPFDETALFELENVQADHLVFNLFDGMGKQVRQSVFESNKFQFQREHLPAGIYFFRIEAGSQMISSGKIVLR